MDEHDLRESQRHLGSNSYQFCKPFSFSALAFHKIKVVILVWEDLLQPLQVYSKFLIDVSQAKPSFDMSEDQSDLFCIQSSQNSN